MGSTERLLRHQLATLAYRTQKAVRGAPSDFGSFEPGAGAWSPHQLMHHMSSLMWYTAHALRGDDVAELSESADFDEEVARFHDLLGEVSALLLDARFGDDRLDERLLQGPLSDAMTHAGQLALLRRLAGSPIAGEDYSRAPISGENVTADQG